jgi:predicted GNAT family N-acyltransferase
MQVHVLPVEWSSHSEVLETIREKVFINEQGVPADIERDGRDADARHFLAITEAGQHIGCARLMPDGQIGRVAVLPDFRSRGIGARLLAAAIEQAKTDGQTSLYLNAQTGAINLYRRAGFIPSGGEFLEAGLPHQRMEMILPIPFESSGDVAQPLVREEAAHPDTDKAELRNHHGEASCVEGIVSVLDHPLREVRIYSPLLDHALFEHDSILDALSQFARSGPPATINILIHTSNLVISRGHRLLNLARRLSSKIEIRLVTAELQEDTRCFVLADQRAFFLMPDDHEYLGHSNAYDPVQSTQLAERFDYLWQRSDHDPELRALSI